MELFRPESAAELASLLKDHADQGRTIQMGGAGTKDAMGGPIRPADVRISSTGLDRVLQYEPHDLTVSVEAGMPYATLRSLLAANRQMVPLDPPFSETATVGGVVATNSSGPRRRLYGTARDLIIGMTFATLEGKLVRSGGMVVKNVAGLDMAKLLIGSFGTLAAIAIVNFKLTPMPEYTRTFQMRFDSAEQALETRNRILRGVLQPLAVDLLNPAAARQLGQEGWILAVEVGGNQALIERYSSEFGGAEHATETQQAEFWRGIREFAPSWLSQVPSGAVVRCAGMLGDVKRIMELADAPALARAGSGVCYVCFRDTAGAADWAGKATQNGWKTVVESAPSADKDNLDLWPCPGDDFAVMKNIKQMFDPRHLLNPGRLYGRL